MKQVKEIAIYAVIILGVLIYQLMLHLVPRGPVREDRLPTGRSGSELSVEKEGKLRLGI